MPQKRGGQYSVYAWTFDDVEERVAAYVDAGTALAVAHGLVANVGAKLGFTSRVMITDGSDRSVFEWEHGMGVIWPEPTTTIHHGRRADIPPHLQ